MLYDNLYTIKKGDTFWGLEKEWNIPFGTLKKLNSGVDPKKLQIGQVIKIKMPTLIYLIADPICYPEQNNSSSDSSEIFQRFNYLENPLDFTPDAINFFSNTTEIGSLGNLIKTRTVMSNELWHFQKNGTLTTPWRRMTSGASHWKNNIVTQHRTAFRTAAKARAFAPKLMRYGGPTLLLADITASGEFKPSHAVSAVMIGASSTGVGAIIAGIYFIADVGTGFATGRSISERLDGWVETNYGNLKLYKGIY